MSHRKPYYGAKRDLAQCCSKAHRMDIQDCAATVPYLNPFPMDREDRERCHGNQERHEEHHAIRSNHDQRR